MDLSQQQQIMQMFAMDLGVVLGAKSELEALQTGAAAILKMGQENATKLMQVWGLAELKKQGDGKVAIALVLLSSQKQLQLAPVQSSFAPVNGAPTSFGTTYAKLGIKFHEINGNCPEGYEIEKYLAGGCVKCKRKKALSLKEELKNGSKKRINKSELGSKVKDADKITIYGLPDMFNFVRLQN